MKIGFTGTQRGMSIDQGRVVLDLLRDLKPEEFHHGCCVGADAQAHKIAKALSISIVIWPPSNQSKIARECLQDAFKIHPADTYLLRNNKIAYFTDSLIATPAGMEEELRSGTWATVRYARRYKRHAYIILSNGKVMEESYA